MLMETRDVKCLEEEMAHNADRAVAPIQKLKELAPSL